MRDEKEGGREGGREDQELTLIPFSTPAWWQVGIQYLDMVTDQTKELMLDEEDDEAEVRALAGRGRKEGGKEGGKEEGVGRRMSQPACSDRKSPSHPPSFPSSLPPSLL